MITAFGSPELFHAARLVRVTELIQKKGFEPEEITKSHWEPLCEVGLYGTLAPSAPITCVTCREVLFGTD